MKTGYWIAISILLVLALILMVFMLSPCANTYPGLGNAIQIGGVFVALITAVIALGTADKERKRIQIDIKHPLTITAEQLYNKSELTAEVADYYKTYTYPLASYRVAFDITNTSNFTLRKPVITFRLPYSLMHPEKLTQNDRVYSIRSFSSNIFNSQGNLQILEVADTRIISNGNLPYLNANDTIPFWIRMVLGKNDTQGYQIEVSVNCENADGVTKQIDLAPSKLLNS